jgi:dTDP-4-amino-4,6-dideoxygalactose transaminase
MIKNNMDFIDEFEQSLCSYTNSKYAVCCDCCTNAILISLYLKMCLGEFSKDDTLVVPARTYMSVPMTLKLFGFKIKFDQSIWHNHYTINTTDKYIGVVDSAVNFHENCSKEFFDDDLICLSFQQKKRLNLGRGGAILTQNEKWYRMLKRMVHDGRNPKIFHGDEVENNPDDILLGFHSYLEPEKAARGIMLLNQPSLLPPFENIHSREYPDLSKLEIFK